MEQKEQSLGCKLISWNIFPLFEKPIRSIGVLLFLIILSFLVYEETASLIWVLFSILILIFSLRQYFLPTCYILYDEQIVCRCLCYQRKVRWEQLKNYFIDKNGVLLSPFQKPTRLENFRGLYLIGANQKPEVMALIKEKINQFNTKKNS